MAPRLRWSEELVTDTTIVPRLEDHLIDDLFYQEDEIGEMRHTAFMVECGLEEDPPDGPDVAPVPWGEMLLKQQQQQMQKQIIEADENVVVQGSVDDIDNDNDNDNDDTNDNDNDNNNDSDNGNGNDSDGGNSYGRKNREPPSRSRSTDDIDTLAIELTSSQKLHQNSRAPKRTNSSPLDLYVADGQSSTASPYVQFTPSSPGSNAAQPKRSGRRPEKRTPNKTPSDDETRVAKPEPTRRFSESQPKRQTPMRGKLTATTSGTCHEMATAAAKARGKLNSEKARKAFQNMVSSSSQSPSPSPGKNDAPAKRKLMKTRSGTCSEMVTAAAKAKKKLNAQKAKKNFASMVSPSTSSIVARRRNSIESIAIKASEKGARPAPLRRTLVATKSGTLHGMRKTPRNTKESSTSDKTKDDESETRIFYKNGKRTVERRGRKSDDSGVDKKTEKVVYRNGKREIVRQHSGSASDNSGSDDEFLGHVIHDSEDESVASISTCGSDHNHLSPRKEQKSALQKPIEQSLKLPMRKRSLTKTEIVNENVSERNRSISSKSVEKDAVKKKKKKKKKKQDDDLDDDSKEIMPDSNSSYKKKKKKKEKDSSDQPDPFISPVTKKNQNAAIFGDVRPGSYPSPSSIRSKNRKSLIKKSSSTEPRKDNGLSQSIINIGKQQGQISRPDNFLGTDPLAAFKKKKKEKAATQSANASREHNRPDDWIGSGKTQKRTWRVKTKTTDNSP